MGSARVVSVETARRLAISRQWLAGPQRPPTADGIGGVVRDLGYLQLDPIRAVERSPLLVLWSRLGAYDPAALDRACYRERRLFEYWAHGASIVHTEHFPVHEFSMRRLRSPDLPASRRWFQSWARANPALRKRVLGQITRDGPLLARGIEDNAERAYRSSGWNSGRNVNRMLDWLWLTGRIMVAGRDGIQKRWDLSERVLPSWTPSERLPGMEAARRAAEISLRALGIARAGHVRDAFVLGRYHLLRVLRDLEAAGRIQRVEVRAADRALPGPWYVHTEDDRLLDRVEAGDWEPRTTLLSPFDNLICDRKRTEELFGFQHTSEIYVPEAKRRYGYYVLPVLHGDRFIGRVDPRMDREDGTLRIHAIHAQPGAPRDAAPAIAYAARDLADFLGAETLEISSRHVPRIWRGSFPSGA